MNSLAIESMPAIYASDQDSYVHGYKEGDVDAWNSITIDNSTKSPAYKAGYKAGQKAAREIFASPTLEEIRADALEKGECDGWNDGYYRRGYNCSPHFPELFQGESLVVYISSFEEGYAKGHKNGSNWDK